MGDKSLNERVYELEEKARELESRIRILEAVTKTKPESIEKKRGNPNWVKRG